jgi:hypothetical protein
MNWGLRLILNLLLSPLDYVFVGLGVSGWLLASPITLAFCLSSTHFFITWCTCLGLSHLIVAYLHDVSVVVTTLVLGLRPRQGVARLRAKRKTWESNHMLPGTQVNSHVGSWSPKRTLKFLECDCRGQNSLYWRIIYIIGKLLKCQCLKWARITHLDIWNTSYGQKKGRELKWQFDSQPLKVGNQPDFLACKQSATYRWKVFDKGYNFALDRIAIRHLHRKLCASKVMGVPIVGLPFRSPGTKNHLDVAPMENCRVYYKGEGGGFPQVRTMVSLVCPGCPWFILAPKALQLCTNHFVLVLCTSLLPSPILEL